MEEGSGYLQHGLARGRREFGGHEPLLWVEIILPRLVDDSDLPEALGLCIRNRRVDLPSFEGDLVARVVEANH